jgi:hypothetical protein
LDLKLGASLLVLPVLRAVLGVALTRLAKQLAR